MIIKSFELNKIIPKKQKIHLLYGENQGQISDLIHNVFKKKNSNNTHQYEEAEVLSNEEIIFNEIQNQSFFEEDKLIIINRSTDKIKDLIEQIKEKKINDVNIVLISGILEKKSKLRSLFEKDKQLVCIPFYKETEQSLVNLTISFCKDKKINISRHLINLIIKRSMNDRLNLKNELNKIEAYSLGGKEINEQNILKLTNQSENYSISTLIDNCLTKNEKTIKEILNENNFSGEECIQIIRTFLMKSKRLLVLSTEVENTKSIDTAIATSKPPIFWKDKEIVKKQLTIWTTEKITKLIKRINLAELLIKKNSANSINILLDFIFKETSKNINNFS
jgi:DNA polymerase III subunit delta